MRTFKLTIDENELRALIDHHHFNAEYRYSIDNSARIHDLTKRLNKRNDEVEEASTENIQPKIEGWS